MGKQQILAQLIHNEVRLNVRYLKCVHQIIKYQYPVCVRLSAQPFYLDHVPALWLGLNQVVALAQVKC